MSLRPTNGDESAHLLRAIDSKQVMGRLSTETSCAPSALLGRKMGFRREDRRRRVSVCVTSIRGERLLEGRYKRNLLGFCLCVANLKQFIRDTGASFPFQVLLFRYCHWFTTYKKPQQTRFRLDFAIFGNVKSFLNLSLSCEQPIAFRLRSHFAGRVRAVTGSWLAAS